MTRRSVRRRVLLVKVACFVLPAVAIVGLMHFMLPVLKEEYDLRRFGSDRDTVQIDTDHFRLYTKHSEKYASDLGEGLERFYAAFVSEEGSRYGIEAGEERALVYVFRDKGELARWSRREYHDPLTNNGGFYSPGRREIAIIARGEDLGEDLLSGYHEAIHMAFDVHLKGLSPWASEGLAVYYGDAVTWDMGRPVWGSPPNRAVGGLALALETDDDRPVLNRLLEARSADFSSEGNHFFYAGSYLLVHYLLGGESGSLAGGFLDYLRGDRGRASSGDRLQRFSSSLGIEPDDLERNWRRYREGLLGRSG